MASTNKNKASNKFKAFIIGRRVEPSSEDRIVTRLLIVLGVAAAAVVLLILMHRLMVGSMSLLGWVYTYIYPWFRWVAVALFAAAIVWHVYTRYFALNDEKESLFTTSEVIGVTACLAFSIWYLYADDNYYPTLVIVIAAGLLGVLAQMFTPIFFRFTLLTSLGAGFWWLAYSGDKTLGCIGLYFIAALILGVFVALKATESKYPADKNVKVPLTPAFLVLAALCVITGVISCAVPAVMPYVVYAYPALFAVTGILCTVNK